MGVQLGLYLWSYVIICRMHPALICISVRMTADFAVFSAAVFSISDIHRKEQGKICGKILDVI